MGGINDPNNGTWNSIRRGVLFNLTAGTSEIKTGGGEYKDETVADSIFPKTINNMNNIDRQNQRDTIDQNKQAQSDKEKAALTAPDAMDATDNILGRTGARRMMSGQGRQSSFLTTVGG